MRSDSVNCWWSVVRGSGRWCLPSTLRHGTAVTPSAARNGAFTSQRRSIPRDSPSSPAGPISGSASWTGRSTRGPRPSTCNGSRRSTTRSTPPLSRSAVSSDSFPTTGKYRCSSSTLATTRSPSITAWPTSAVNASPAFATTGSYADPPPRPNRPPGTGGRPLGTDGDKSARIQQPGRGHRPASFPLTPAMAPSR